jgi:hypothetical protein
LKPAKYRNSNALQTKQQNHNLAADTFLENRTLLEFCLNYRQSVTKGYMEYIVLHQVLISFSTSAAHRQYCVAEQTKYALYARQAMMERINGDLSLHPNAFYPNNVRAFFGTIQNGNDATSMIL